MSSALILAGGGLTGLAWEAGVVVGLSESGVDLSTADLVLGTSAGSIIGSLLLAGVEPAEFTRLIADPDNPPLRMSGKPKTDGDMMANVQVLTLWSAVPAMDSPNVIEIAEASSRGKTMTEDAWVDTFGESFGSLSWSPKMRIVSIDTETGERRVWSEADGVELNRVVASSCAVPGVFPAVEVDGKRYIDGGLWSNTSADLLPDTGIDDLVIISPLGGKADWSGEFSDRATDRELELLAPKGIRIETVRPENPISPITSFDKTQRIASYERGVVDGRAAAERISKVL